MNLPASEIGYRIDINTATGNAYRSLFENARLAAAFGWLPLAIVFCVEFAAFFVVGGGKVGLVLSGLARAIGMLVFGTVFVTRWYRFRLLGETESRDDRFFAFRAAEGDRFRPFDKTQARRFFTRPWQMVVAVSFKLVALLLVGTFVLFVIAGLPPHIITAPLTILGAVAMAVAAVRVSLAFPAAALEEPILFRTSWELLAENYWRLFVCAFLCYVPFAVAEGGLDRAGAGKGWGAVIAIEIVALAVEFAGMAVLASLLSEVYRRIMEEARVEAQR